MKAWSKHHRRGRNLITIWTPNTSKYLVASINGKFHLIIFISILNYRRFEKVNKSAMPHRSRDLNRQKANRDINMANAFLTI